MTHLYVHVPFCRRRCSYCDFAIAVRRDIPHAAFVETVLREITLRADVEPEDAAPVQTIYVGGGTPSLLAPRHLHGLLNGLRTRFPLVDTPEVTLEANPDDVHAASVAAWREAGVNRVSLGVQSLRPEVLAWMHRTHTAADGLRAVDTLLDGGIANLSADVIFGLPADLGATPLDDLRDLANLGVPHLSVYGLTIESRTPLDKWHRRGEVRGIPDTRYETEFLAIHEALADRGYGHYEVSNYARVGHESRHNQGYWSGASYLGLGPSAHSFAPTLRRWNRREWTDYRAAVGASRDPVAATERLGPDARYLEAVYLGLRTNAGLPIDTPTHGPTRTAATAEGWLEVHDNRLVATPAGWVRLDSLVAGLTTLPDGG